MFLEERRAEIPEAVSKSALAFTIDHVPGTGFVLVALVKTEVLIVGLLVVPNSCSANPDPLLCRCRRAQKTKGRCCRLAA